MASQTLIRKRVRAVSDDRQEFKRLDGLGNKDWRLQRSELYAEFPPDGNAAFKKGWD
jgi:hypothetical protein